RMVISGGGWGDCSIARAVSPMPEVDPSLRRSAAINDTQKRVGLLSSSSSENQATCAGFRLAHAESRGGLPKPAAADRSESLVVSASSSTASKLLRSTNECGRRGGESLLDRSAILWSKGCTTLDSCTSVLAVSSN